MNSRLRKSINHITDQDVPDKWEAIRNATIDKSIPSVQKVPKKSRKPRLKYSLLVAALGVALTVVLLPNTTSNLGKELGQLSPTDTITWNNATPQSNRLAAFFQPATKGDWLKRYPVQTLDDFGDKQWQYNLMYAIDKNSGKTGTIIGGAIVKEWSGDKWILVKVFPKSTNMTYTGMIISEMDQYKESNIKETRVILWEHSNEFGDTRWGYFELAGYNIYFEAHNRTQKEVLEIVSQFIP